MLNPFENSTNDLDSQNAWDMFYFGTGKYLKSHVFFGNGGGSGGAAPAGDPDDPGNLGGMGMSSGMSAALGDAFDGDPVAANTSFGNSSQPSTSPGQHGVPIAALPNNAISNEAIGKALTVAFSATPMGLALAGLTAAGAFAGEPTGDISGIGLGAGDNPIVNKNTATGLPNMPNMPDSPTAGSKKSPPAVEPPSFFETETVAERAGNITAANVRKRVGRLSMFYARPDRLTNPYIFIPSLTSIE